ncbi:NlpC/P60 family (YycO) [Fructobacillus fructosus]|uniref:YiiX/YebB-like N1pC/P60 family cysteine hydrolase n=1 Tax=Fructobacillus fructosus TaxID=1631 RepID=UPI002D9AA23E|nr:NlpC/P60 family (YycO) [Fructobacillus fructosus]
MNHYQNADLAFVTEGRQAMDRAIAASRNSQTNKRFVHVAILERTSDDYLFVIESTGKRGVIRRPFQEFINEHQQAIAIYRSKKVLQHPEKIIQMAKTQLGQPYNHGFFEKGPGLYCSQLVLKCFEKENLFHEEPLSFGPEGTVLPHWIHYYQKLGKDIPRNEKGSSPNSLIASNQLKLIDAI